MNTSKYLILGGGMVAGYAAKQLVETGLKPRELTIVSGDSSNPYERPPLSKGFPAGKDTETSIFINPDDFYRAHDIEIRLNCVSVTWIPPGKVCACSPARKSALKSSSWRPALA
jgi:3-phenylpropionate/trans-cinnamate dioxygenase ferredoxin reductase subunit